MLEEKIQNDLTEAIKSKDSKRANTLRGIKSAFTEFKTAPKGNRNPEDSDLLKILQKMAKQRKETGDLYVENGRQDLAEEEYFEYNIISEYLPKMLSESEITEIAKKTISDLNASSMKDMGKVIGAINKAYAGQVEGSVVAKVVKDLLK